MRNGLSRCDYFSWVFNNPWLKLKEAEFKLFRYWSVLGCAKLHAGDRIEALKHVGYTRDYTFYTAETLNLVCKED